MNLQDLGLQPHWYINYLPHIAFVVIVLGGFLLLVSEERKRDE